MQISKILFAATLLGASLSSAATTKSKAQLKAIDQEQAKQAGPVKPDPEISQRIHTLAQSSAQPSQDPDVSRYVGPAQYASAAYCIGLSAGQTLHSDATILYAAGNGRDVQRVFVAYSPTDGIIVAHQGTNTSSIDSIENDIVAYRTDPDSRIAFLGDVGVNKGFQNAWLDTADAVLSSVQSALSSYPGSSILVTGHSLGAAIALYNAAYIQHETGVYVSTRLFGLPRAGNQNFADAIDNFLDDQIHVVNADDPVPHLPGNFLGYVHPSGEVWIQTNGANSALDCPGQENTNCAWTVEPSDYATSNHHGPYFGVNMGC